MRKPAAPPCTIVIFGARGDLTKRLLMPALYNLVLDKLLDTDLRILGVDHGDVTKDAWIASLSDMMQQFTKDASAEFHPDVIDAQCWSWITERCDYLRGDFDDAGTYANIAKNLEAKFADSSARNVIFYVATSPAFFARVIDGLGHAELLREDEHAFRRVVIEKPFGHDEPSAKVLNAQILKQADEAQFYRIDHFMGKEPVRGIFSWRFANRLFEPIWNSEHIDHVQITAAETIGVEERGSFYEATGALRDMVPSHLFSAMSMLAMEPPASLATEDVRDAHARVLKSIVPLEAADAVRGQYRAGNVQGKPMSAYREADKVDPQSRTETYAALRIRIDTPRWRGVPFYMRTGKALKAHTTSIVVRFKPSASLWLEDNGAGEPNRIEFQLSGQSGIFTDFLAKQPGPQEELMQVASSFRYDAAFPKSATVGYESLLYDCMGGQQKLFLREDAIDAAWHAVQPVLDAWSDGGEPQFYAAGSSGPSDADALLAASGRAWQPLL